MPRGPSPVKPQQWTERLHRFEESQQTVAEFCKAEGVSEASFYQWKRRLGRATRSKTLPAPRRSQASARPRPSFQSDNVRDTEHTGDHSIAARERDGTGERSADYPNRCRRLLTHQATRGPAIC